MTTKRKLIIGITLGVVLLAGLILVFRPAAPRSLAEAPSQYAQADGVRIHYKTVGKGRKALVFVHGFGCDMNVWGKQFEAFHEVDSLKLVFVDLPGYGGSDKPHTDYTLSYFASAVKAVVDVAAPEDELVLVGHSLGTPVCRQFCKDYPGRVTGLCDVDGVYCLYPPEDSPAEERNAYEAEVQAFASMFQGDSVDENIRLFVYSLAGENTPEEIGTYALEIMPRTPEYVAYSTMKNLIDPRWWAKEEGTIDAPSLIICTRNSGITEDNREQMEALYSHITYWELTTCGHFIQWEESEAFNSRLSDFINKTE